MKIMKQVKQIAHKCSTQATATAIAVSAMAATNVYAGPLAEAVRTESAEFKTDLYAVAGIVISLAMVGVGVVMVIRMMRRS